MTFPQQLTGPYPKIGPSRSSSGWCIHKTPEMFSSEYKKRFSRAPSKCFWLSPALARQWQQTLAQDRELDAWSHKIHHFFKRLFFPAADLLRLLWPARRDKKGDSRSNLKMSKVVCTTLRIGKYLIKVFHYITKTPFVDYNFYLEQIKQVTILSKIKQLLFFWSVPFNRMTKGDSIDSYSGGVKYMRSLGQRDCRILSLGFGVNRNKDASAVSAYKRCKINMVWIWRKKGRGLWQFERKVWTSGGCGVNGEGSLVIWSKTVKEKKNYTKPKSVPIL